ncbi:MAG TPA: alpha/beta hydrolase [Gammaproteobacteria bacterium]
MSVVRKPVAQIDVGFVDKPAIQLLRVLFPILSKLAPSLAAKISLRIFLTPQRFKTPKWEMEYQRSATRRSIRVGDHRVETYSWGEGSRKILLCHSWGGRGTQLASFVKPLVERNCTVVTFDAPAHGRSTGKFTDMVEYSSTINEVVRNYDGFDAIIGHSFGAGNTMYSKHLYGFDVERIVLIGCFAHGSWVTERFGEILNIPSKIVARMRGLLEEKYDNLLRWDELDIVRMVDRDSSRVMLVHDMDDKEIPYFNAMKFMETCEAKVVFVSSNKLGHRRILRDARIVGEVCDFAAANPV